MSKDAIMDRRNFFRRSLGKVVSVGSDYVEHKAVEKAKAWIRPPFALAELDFLLTCSHCGDCIDACPHDVIFELPLQRGASVAGTPAMDIPNNACLLCTDWACVNSCKDQALFFTVSQNPVIESDEETVVECKSTATEQNKASTTESGNAEVVEMPQAQDCPPMASAHIDESMCMPYSGPECGACWGSCPIEDTLVWNNEKPSIKIASCIGCGQCVQACITSPKAITISQYQQVKE